MFSPPGFAQRLTATSLGCLVYDTAGPLLAEPSEPPSEPLVFLHGFGGGSSSFEWSKVTPAFTPHYRVVAPDLLGWGRSDHPERRYTVQDYVTTISEFLEQVGPPAAVVASSLVGALTVQVAVARPELFSRLILICPSGLSDFDEDFSQSLIAKIAGVPLLDRLIYDQLAANALAIRNFLEERQFANPNRVSEEMVQAYLASARQPNAEYAALSFLRGDLCFDLSTFMPKLNVPTVVFWGRQAQFTPLEVGQKLARLSAAVREFCILEDVGLTPHLELPAVTIAALIQALAKLDAPAPTEPTPLVG